MIYGRILLASLLGLLIISCNKKVNFMGHNEANQLINESSPYLLQHAYNPVDWHPWNAKTLAKAKAENKMMIVSIGYAACHWCHVMEHQSFEDSTVAALMNEHFIPVKVDREERPDVDDIYMTAAQLITGRGGWPLNAFTLADGRPVWAGTYFPKEQWLNILQQFANLQKDDPQRLVKSATQITQGINDMDTIVRAKPGVYQQSDLKNIANTLIKRFDMIDGGRRGAPKFPMPTNLEFLLRYGVSYQEDSALEAMHLSLEKMALGGIYDQIGGGFARYSVDAKWLVPHFEKMLYDNGQLVSLYSDAYRLSKSPLYKHVLEQTLGFVERELMDERSRFYSSLDADSEGVEGKFYVWREEEIDQVITNPLVRTIIKKYYNLTTDGNWEHGNNILHITQTKETIAQHFDISIKELDEVIQSANSELLTARADKIRPGLDDKVLTSWNALMIKGFVDAYKAIGHDAYLHRAKTAMNHLIGDQMSKDGRLDRNYKNGKASINAFLDDYALTIQAVLSLYEVTFDHQWLAVAQKMTDYAIAHFYNEDSGMFHFTSDQDPALIARKTELPDNVIPSSNSVMARSLLWLGELINHEEYTTMAQQMMANMWPQISAAGQPGYYTNWLSLLLDHLRPPYEIAILGADATAVSHEMMQTYHPNAHYLGSTSESKLPLLAYKYIEDQTTIYVCQNKVCQLPTEDVQEALLLIR